MAGAMGEIERAVTQLVEKLEPRAKILRIEPLAPDGALVDETGKAAGYGAPLRIDLETAAHERRSLVLRTATANDFGHDRRSDRAQSLLLAFDSFGQVPAHVRPLDVGAIAADGRLISLKDAGELYLVTTWADGELYVDDLRRIAHEGVSQPQDLARAAALARYLVELHRSPIDRPPAYRRAIRDLVGHGEGIFGIVDDYGPGVPGAPPARLQAIERRCLDWRWRLRNYHARLRQTHGDFHPFNVVFQSGVGFTLLDASRGGQGDPADDVAAMAINYVFFALEHASAWPGGFAPLWRRFLGVYLDGSHDGELAEVIAPFLAWRGLVLANPSFYPSLPANDRDRLLGFVERVLDAPRFDPRFADELFA
jgi:aminoglycoside phosphotransferase (APT) family kinase protein